MNTEASQASVLARQQLLSQTSSIDSLGKRPREMHPLRSLLDVVTLTLAILGIGFAIWQFFDSRRVIRNTQEILSDASTKYVAEFPGNLPEIAKLINETCGSLRILADVPGYGMYSDPRQFLEYYAALLKVAHSRVGANRFDSRCAGKIDSKQSDDNHPDIRILLWSPADQERKGVDEQFDAAWRRELQDNRAEQAKFLRFLDNNHTILPQGETPNDFMRGVASGKDYTTFINFLVRRHHAIEEDLYNSGAEIRYAKEALIYMRIWDQDSGNAVFSFDHTPVDGNETEIAFRSRDVKLLTTFDKMFDQHWEDAIRYEDYRDTAKRGNASLGTTGEELTVTTGSFPLLGPMGRRP